MTYLNKTTEFTKTHAQRFAQRGMHLFDARTVRGNKEAKVRRGGDFYTRYTR